MKYSTLIAHIILSITFFCMFGYENILRYLRGGVTVLKYDEIVEDGIPSPGITFMLDHTKIYSFFVIVISIKSASTILAEGLCKESHNLEDFEKCVQDIRTPYIDQINFKSYSQSFELNHAGASDFIYPGKNSITVEMSPKLLLNKVSDIMMSNLI